MMELIVGVGLIILIASSLTLSVFLFAAPCEALGEAMANKIREKFSRDK